MTAALSFIFGLPLAFKLVLLIGVILTPLSIYYCARKFEFNKIKSSLIMLLGFAIFFLPEKIISDLWIGGGTFYSTFNVGVVANALAIPFFFFYLGRLNESFKKKKYVFTSIIFSLIVLTHVFTAAAAGIFLVSFMIVKLRKKEDLAFFLRHILLSFLLLSFWLLPFIYKIGYASKAFIQFPVTQLTIASILLGCALVLIIIYKKTAKKILPIISFFFIISILYLSGNIFHLRIHIFRFVFFILLVIPFLLFKLVNKKIVYYSIFLLCIIVIFFNWNTFQAEFTEDIAVPDFG